MRRPMRWLFAIDIRILDDVFQPIADVLAGWASCFRLAHVCLLAAMVGYNTSIAFLTVQLLVTGSMPSQFVLLAIGYFIMVRTMSRDYGKLAVVDLLLHREGTANPLRYDWWHRIVIWAVCIVVGSVDDGVWYSNLMLVAFCFWLMGLYFMACRKNPPRPLFQIAPAPA